MSFRRVCMHDDETLVPENIRPRSGHGSEPRKTLWWGADFSLNHKLLLAPLNPYLVLCNQPCLDYIHLVDIILD